MSKRTFAAALAYEHVSNFSLNLQRLLTAFLAALSVVAALSDGQ